MNEVLGVLLLGYRDFFANPKTWAVLGFIAGFTALACVLGLRARVLSAAALRNTGATLAVLAVNLLMAPVVYVIAGKMLSFYASLGIPSVPESFWGGVPWIVVALAGLAAKDFADYWSHRLLHTPLFWPIHAVHHSDTHVNGFTTFRVHVLELVVMNISYIALLSWLGIPSAMIAAAYIFASLHNAYIHFEIDIDHGPLNWLIASPRFHRWHHADYPPAYGKNLANMIPLYDVLFGTYYRAGPCLEKMGAEREGISGTDAARLVLLPFTLWGRKITQSLRALAGKRHTELS